MVSAFYIALVLGLVASANAGCGRAYLRRHSPAHMHEDTITIVTTNDTAPFMKADADGVPCGLDFDLMNVISYIYGFSFVYEYKSFQELIPAVQADDHTISISTQTDTLEREQMVNFAHFFQSGTGFLAQSSFTGTIETIGDLCGLTVGVITGSTQEGDVQQQSTECGTNSINVVTFTGHVDLIDGLTNGEVQVAVGDQAINAYDAAQSGGALVEVGTPYNVQPFGIACNKDFPELCCALVDAINHLINDGTYQRILESHSFKMSDNGVCPSRFNLHGGMCSRRCVPSPVLCDALAEENEK